MAADERVKNNDLESTAMVSMLLIKGLWIPERLYVGPQSSGQHSKFIRHIKTPGQLEVDPYMGQP